MAVAVWSNIWKWSRQFLFWNDQKKRELNRHTLSIQMRTFIMTLSHSNTWHSADKSITCCSFLSFICCIIIFLFFFLLLLWKRLLSMLVQQIQNTQLYTSTSANPLALYVHVRAIFLLWIHSDGIFFFPSTCANARVCVWVTLLSQRRRPSLCEIKCRSYTCQNFNPQYTQTSIDICTSG